MDQQPQALKPPHTWHSSQRVIRSVVTAHPGTRAVFYNRETKEIWEERVLLWCVYRHRFVKHTQYYDGQRPVDGFDAWEVLAGGLICNEGAMTHPEEFESVFVGYLNPDEERSSDWWGRNGVTSPEHDPAAHS